MRLLISEGNPPAPGTYVAYVNGPSKLVAERIFLVWFDGHWSYPLSDQRYRDHVYGWVGPLDAMELTE